MIAADVEPRVGPNAILQLTEALIARGGRGAADALLAHAGLDAYRRDPPEGMIPQSQAIAAHRALSALHPPMEAERIAFEAGLRTGDYLLAHRIPKLAQALLTLLPARLAARLLVKAIARHAWTFAGSGRFSARVTETTVVLEIAANPLAANPCAWHRGVFTRLFRALVSRRASVAETACFGAGAPACRFEITLR